MRVMRATETSLGLGLRETCIRDEVHEWRNAGYEDAPDTSKVLLRWWFAREHPF